MDWKKDISFSAKETMNYLGSFSPTVIIKNKEIKGWIDGKVYWNSEDLRNMAKSFIEVADWLDKRASETVLPHRQDHKPNDT